MNEIEKMYNNCNLLKPHAWSCKLDRIKFSGVCCELAEKGLHCKDCNNSQQEYYHPPFTEKKQIKLIKWLSQYCVTIDCEDGEYEVYTGFDDNVIDNFYDKLEDAIAYCVNKIWEDLSEEEKQQITEILK